MEEKVTVLMSVYNEEESVLRESINSILNQTYNNLEIIIVNDNPKNKEIGNILDSIKDSRIIVLKNKENKGLVKSLNFGLKYVTSNYIARMDADDISEKERIEKQMKYLKEGEFDLVGCAIRYIDENGKSLHRIEKYPMKNRDIMRRNRWKQCVAHPTFLVKKEVYDQLKGYRNVDCCEDYDFICRCLYSGFKISNNPEVLLNYRIRSTSISSVKMIDQKVRSYYIGGLKSEILNISEDEIMKYFVSKEYLKEINLCTNYYNGKKLIQEKRLQTIFLGIEMIMNKYLVYAIMRKIYR